MPTPRKSDAAHWLTGTKTQAKPEAELPMPPGRPKYPKGISPEAKAVFKRLCSLLEKRRALTEGDGELLRLYAVIFDRHARAISKIAEQGEICVYTRLDSNGQPHDIEKENLWLKVAANSEKNLVAILDRLGLTPHNRSKIKPTAQPKIDTAQEAFDDFLHRRGPAPEFKPDLSEVN